MSSKVAYVLDVKSGNLQSLQNSIERAGFEIILIETATELRAAIASEKCQKLFLPGVGNFGHFMCQINKLKLREPILEYIASGKALMGICVGLQALFNDSEESPNLPDESNDNSGLKLINRTLKRFDATEKSVPEIGWNSVIPAPGTDAISQGKDLYGISESRKYYFVNSYASILTKEEVELAKQGRSTEITGFKDCEISLTTYGSETFVSAISKGNVFVTQFHPEKSGKAGLKVIEAFLNGTKYTKPTEISKGMGAQQGFTRRVIACLDVRANDNGDLVVTKGDQYDVRERQVDGAGNPVRNLGKPVEMARKYYEQGADEVTFLNITSFRNSPIADLPMLEVLRQTSKSVFVPLTVGGGIRDIVDPSTGKLVPALEVASMYFLSGADKVSIGSDAVYAAEAYYARGGKGDGKSPLETISKAYGIQAVVVSVDPKRVYVASPEDAPSNIKVIPTKYPGPNGEKYVWYQCTVKGGRESRPIGVYELVRAVEALGAGELLLNCIDKDGSNSGYDFELIELAKSAVSIPVIASSGAGVPQHFVDVFEHTSADAALGAGMFHRGEYTVNDVKAELMKNGISTRNDIGF
ncbi:hypothetical protein D0Z03_001054 [Geotrichum reessii]|nr:hypothetical protein D0Z03_001054 [Galactomyces reessii]